jgi:hypothetical protein
MEFADKHGVSVTGPLAWAWRLGALVVEYTESGGWRGDKRTEKEILEALRDSTDPAYKEASAAVRMLLKVWEAAE